MTDQEQTNIFIKKKREQTNMEMMTTNGKCENPVTPKKNLENGFKKRLNME